MFLAIFVIMFDVNKLQLTKGLGRICDSLSFRNQEIHNAPIGLHTGLAGVALFWGLNNYLWSIIHMVNNRIFRTQQRMHELIIYSFLAIFYKSFLSRQKVTEIADEL